MAPTKKALRVKVMSRLKLGSKCCVVGCNTTSGTIAYSKIKMFRFPRDEERRRAWTAVVRREAWKPGKKTRICSTHFITGAPSVDPLNPDYVPSLFKYISGISASQKKLKRTSVVKSIHADTGERCTAVGTDLSMADIEQLQNEKFELQRKVALLKMKLELQENEYKIRLQSEM